MAGGVRGGGDWERLDRKSKLSKRGHRKDEKTHAYSTSACTPWIDSTGACEPPDGGYF